MIRYIELMKDLELLCEILTSVFVSTKLCKKIMQKIMQKIELYSVDDKSKETNILMKSMIMHNMEWKINKFEKYKSILNLKQGSIFLCTIF